MADEPLHVRRATALDTGAMTRLLNPIIETGGTTAKTNPVTPAEILAWFRIPGTVWHVAEHAGEIVGFQWIEPHDALPVEALDIATFVQQGRTGLGIGSALFAATEPAARDLGYRWINATIRADNSVGLAYYQSRGFRVWKRIEGDRLADGQVVDRVCTRFDLD
jgi:GNAT superfamily N-acetyltransferase